MGDGEESFADEGGDGAADGGAGAVVAVGDVGFAGEGCAGWVGAVVDVEAESAGDLFPAGHQTLADHHTSAASHAQRLQAVRDLYGGLNIQVKIVDNRRGTPLRLALAGTLDHTDALNATDPEHPQKRASWCRCLPTL
nr:MULTISPECIES: hypothetical protein [unclassified Frankia]